MVNPVRNPQNNDFYKNIKLPQKEKEISNGVKPVVLLILDGFGVAPPGEGNAVSSANTPALDKLITTYPAITLSASGMEVGLRLGEMGNSEVGHLNIGAGRVYYQTLPRINKAISDREFFKNPVFLSAAEYARKNKSSLHLLGLVSPGGIHSHEDHLYALLEFAKQQKIKKVYIHAILDGRDTLKDVGIDFINKLEGVIKKLKVGKIATLMGRFYAMDRDNRWDRTEKAYRALANGDGQKAKDPSKAIQESYKKKIYDEEFAPTVIIDGREPVAKIKDGDAVIFFNFRADRARQLCKAFVLTDFDKFPRPKKKKIFFAAMVEYEAGLPVQTAFPPDLIIDCLSKVISDHGLKQFHIAETEKYAHITFFINGQKEEPFPGEERVIVPSPRVSSYDQKPEMSAKEITNRAIQELESGKYDIIMMNFANPDMVGHTGNLLAAIKAVETVDKCIGKIVDTVLAQRGVVFITADHGNVEEMRNFQTGEVVKEHSTNPVPFILVSRDWEGKTMGLPEGVGADLSLVPPTGILGDVAPTILKIMGIKQPEEMTGQPLI